jgi:dTDP-4-amino-4,6-dideoxygalactose transaminase
MNNYSIPFNKPLVVEGGLGYIANVIASSNHSGDGPFTKQCHALLETVLGVRKALLTTSCTHALEMISLLLDLQPGDEVIVPSFTFVSTANAYALRGVKIVFADVRPDTLNLDETRLEQLITQRTKAIVPVHYAGIGCEMDEIITIAARHNVAVVEDNAHGLFGKYKGRWLGTLGCLATQSFHETKNFSCGEGGALLINDPMFIERAEIIREKGTNRSRFFRGQVDKYSWVDLGSSYLSADILAAFLYSQLEVWENVQSRRRQIWETYFNNLCDWALEAGVKLPTVPAHCEPAWHMFYLLMPSLAARQELIARLKSRGILAVFHYLPLHLSDYGKRLDGQSADCPVTEDVSDRLLRLPFFYSLTKADQAYVIEVVREFIP